MKKYNPIKILLLEDDRLYNETLCDYLEEEGFEVIACYDPHSAFELSFSNQFDIYIFDINLPFQDGLKTLEELRQSGDNTPLLFLTSREDKTSLYRAFELGAVDYLRKPIDIEELIIRLKAHLKRYYYEKPLKQLGIYIIDVNSNDLILDGEPLHLGRKIYSLLELFIDSSGKVVTTQEIKDRLWHYEESASDGAIRVYITRLKKLFPNVIENIRGVGYRFNIDRIKSEQG